MMTKPTDPTKEEIRIAWEKWGVDTNTTHRPRSRTPDMDCLGGKAGLARFIDQIGDDHYPAEIAALLVNYAELKIWSIRFREERQFEAALATDRKLDAAYQAIPTAYQW